MSVTLGDVVKFCMDEKAKGRLFSQWTEEQIASELYRYMFLSNPPKAVVNVTKEGKVNGVVAFLIKPEQKEVHIENILTTEPKVCGKMYEKILEIAGLPVNTDGWVMTGIHRTKRDRKFPMNEAFLRRLYHG